MAARKDSNQPDQHRYFISVTDKGKGKNVSGSDINYSTWAEQWTLDRILAWIKQGHAIVPCHLADYAKGKLKTNFKCSNLLMLDIDGGLSIDDFKKHYSHQALAIYTSPSHQKPKGDNAPCDRYRVLCAYPGTLTHAALQELIYKMCVIVFGHDKGCVDPCRLYFGNPEALVTKIDESNVLDLSWLHSQFQKHSSADLYRDVVVSVAFDHDLSVRQLNDIYAELMRNQLRGSPLSKKKSPTVFNIDLNYSIKEARRKSVSNTPKTERSSYHRTVQHYNFDFLKKNCSIARNAKSTDHHELLHLIRNMIHVEGGRKFIMALLEKRPYKVKDRGEDYYERLWGYFSTKDSSPTYCNENCEFYRTEKCKASPTNLLALQPRKKTEWKVISEQEAGRPLAEVRKLLNETVQAIIDKNDRNVHLVIAETGIGKSTAVQKAKINVPFTFSGPTHEQLKGVDLGALYPDLPKNLKAAAGAFYAKGISPRKALKGTKHSDALKKFEQDAATANTSAIKRITHERLFCDRNIRIGDLLIIDEDIKDSVLKTGSVPIDYIKRIAREANMIPPTEKLANLLESILATPVGRVHKNDPAALQKHQSVVANLAQNTDDFELRSEDWTAADIEEALEGRGRKHVKIERLPVGDIFSLLGSDYTIRDQRFVHFVTRRKISFAGTTIVLSATADEEIYRTLFGKRLVVHRMPKCEVKGELLQYGEYSFSLETLKGKKRVQDLVSVATAAKDRGDFIVTHKSARNLLGFEIGDHFGNTEGKNYATGRNVTVIGTQNLPPSALKLQAAALGLNVENIRDYSEGGVQQTSVVYQGIEFHYTLLSEDEKVRHLQLHFSYESLMQSAGRARYLEHPVTVRVYSQLPLPGFERTD
jgi:hypothetical protein